MNQAKIQKIFLLSGIISAFLANILGAFGTHALKTVLSSYQLEVFKTGVQYQFYHSLALCMVALLMFHITNKWVRASGISFIAGIGLFCGSLYLLSLSTIKNIGFITPIGGLAFLLGWLFLALGIIYHKNNN